MEQAAAAGRGNARRIRLYYLASGAIAVPALQALLACPTVEVLGCATQPDQPSGRHRVPTPTPVGRFCQEHNLPLQRPETVNAADFLAFLESLRLDFVLVFAFGQILARALLALPRIACVNVHASLLPRYRGAAPVSAAILGGDTRAGISIMKVVPKLDAGPVYEQHSLALREGERAGELEVRLAELAAAHTGAALGRIAEGLLPQPQDPALVSYAPRLQKENGRIDWASPALQIERMTRAYHPWPGAWFVLETPKGHRKITITAAVVEPAPDEHAPGTVVTADKDAWRIACGKNLLKILTLIPEGKKEMSGADFLRGSPLPVGISVSQHEANYC